MTPNDTHPSFLTLDRVALGDSAGAAEVEQHLAGCARCREHCAQVKSGAPAPAWARALEQKPVRSALARWWALPTFAMAAAVALLLLARPAPRAPSGVVEKGAPAVAAYVRRGGQVFRWDGRLPLRAGDELRLQVAAAGYREVSVASLNPDGGVEQQLYEGAIRPTGATLLDAGWKVDAVGSREILRVTLSSAPDQGAPWRTTLVFQKGK